MEGGINREEDDANRVSVDFASLLEYVISTEEKGGVGVAAI